MDDDKNELNSLKIHTNDLSSRNKRKTHYKNYITFILMPS